MLRPRAAAHLGLMAVLVAGCGAPILANPTLPPGAVATHAPTSSRAPDPQPILFPRDDEPHDRLTEWWYYTGHLKATDGRHFGFEAVVFRAERGVVPVSWASHLALTDEAGDRFLYAQRAEIGPQVDPGVGYLLGIRGAPFAEGPASIRDPWAFGGLRGNDRINAWLAPDEADAAGGAFGLSLSTTAQKDPALHGGTGWIDFEGAGSSYYYSRTRMTVAGTLTLDGTDLEVTGTAWFDHQWGDFIAVGGGGWDWFAVNLDDGTDLTISLVRAADGSFPLVYGTLVDADGQATNLNRDAFTVETDPARTWTSPSTGAAYPAGWTITIPGQGLVIGLEPTVANQELDTRATTGVVYWEGSQVVSATRDGLPVGGEAYVELTGYAPAATTNP